MVEAAVVGSKIHCPHTDVDNECEGNHSVFTTSLSPLLLETFAASSRTRAPAAAALPVEPQKGARQRLYMSYLSELPLAAATGARTTRVMPKTPRMDSVSIVKM